MTAMYAKILPPPGVVKTQTDYDSGGRWISGDKYRFVAGLPEKLGGWLKVSASPTTLTGVCRGAVAWRDNAGNKRLAMGTHKKLYTYYAGTTFDITPFRAGTTGTLGATPLTTSNGSAVVTVAHTAHGQVSNDWVTLTQGTALNGVTLLGNFQITVTGANAYTVVGPNTANASSSGGGTVTYTYYRRVLGAAPFATVSGSATVTITDAAHGAIAGDTAVVAGASAVAGLTLSGSYVIMAVTTNTYTVTASGNANATTTGGGSGVSVQYEITVGNVDNIDTFGYGVGTYNTAGAANLAPNDGYGVARSTSITLPVRTWSVAPYGQTLYANPWGGGIFTWDPTSQGTTNRALPLYGAPTANNAILITDERFLIAIGTGTNGAMRLAWPDQNDTTAWVSTATNTANNGRNIIGGNTLMGGVKLRGGASLILSDTDAFSHQYTGDNFVFDTHRVGSACGLVGPNAICEYGGVAYWMSPHDFMMYDGYVRPLPTDDIRDYVFKNLTVAQRNKCVAGVNAGHREIWFFWPNAGSENSDYAVFHLDQQCWSTGTLVRTAWIDKSIFPNPMGWDASGYFYNHESGTDNDTAAMDSTITFAPTDFSNLLPANQSGISPGDSIAIMGIVPDFKRVSGTVSLTLLTRGYPSDSDTSSPVYSDLATTQRIDTRESGNMCGLKIESNALSADWRYGALRLEVQRHGSRR